MSSLHASVPIHAPVYMKKYDSIKYIKEIYSRYVPLICLPDSELTAGYVLRTDFWVLRSDVGGTQN